MLPTGGGGGGGYRSGASGRGRDYDQSNLNATVECSVHKRSRLMKYCDQRRIYNADGQVIGHTFVCSRGNECHVPGGPVVGGTRSEAHVAVEPNSGVSTAASAATTGMPWGWPSPQTTPIAATAAAGGRMARLPQVSDSDNEGDGSPGASTVPVSLEISAAPGKSSGGPVTPVEGASRAAVATVMSPTSATTIQVGRVEHGGTSHASRGPARYYDINQTNRVDDETGRRGKKVCWGCGMDTHEKPECPNVLCRTCHRRKDPNHHQCNPVPLSPFVVLDTQLSGADMEGVCCVACGREGHMDCSQPLLHTFRPMSCCFCGCTGHNAYDCRRRQMSFPDRWVRAVMEAAHAAGATGPPASLHPGVSPGVSSRHGGADMYSGSREYHGAGGNQWSPRAHGPEGDRYANAHQQGRQSFSTTGHRAAIGSGAGGRRDGESWRAGVAAEGGYNGYRRDQQYSAGSPHSQASSGSPTHVGARRNYPRDEPAPRGGKSAYRDDFRSRSERDDGPRRGPRNEPSRVDRDAGRKRRRHQSESSSDGDHMQF